jgi:tetratricopeptide (TPR) repeat protein
MSIVGKIAGVRSSFEVPVYVQKKPNLALAAQGGKTLALFQAENTSVTKEQAQKHYEEAYSILRGPVDLAVNDEFPKEKIQKALDELQKAVHLNPDCLGFYLLRGACMADMGEFDKALVDFNKAIAINPEYKDRYFTKGKAFYLRATVQMMLSIQNLIRDGIEDIKKAAEMGEENAPHALGGLYEMVSREFLYKLLCSNEEREEAELLIKKCKERLVKELNQRGIAFDEIYDIEEGFEVFTANGSFIVKRKYLEVYDDYELVFP